MIKAAGLAVVLVGACVAAGPSAAQLYMHREISYETAKTIAETAMAHCTAQNRQVSIHVVDSRGDTIVSLRADGARDFTYENSYEKAYTAAAFRRPSAEMAAEYAEGNPTRAQQADFPHVVLIGGGLPIMANGEVVGAIGISGAPSEVNDTCGQAGIDAVAAQLQ